MLRIDSSLIRARTMMGKDSNVSVWLILRDLQHLLVKPIEIGMVCAIMIMD